MKTRLLGRLSVVGVLAGLVVCTGAASANAATLAEFDAAAAGAGMDPTQVTPPWTYYSGSPQMLNNGSYLEQNFTASEYGYYGFNTLPAGTFNVGVADYGISVTMQPISSIDYAGSGYASIFLQWQDNQSYYGLTFWKEYGVTYGASGSGLMAVDWSVAHDVFVGYNHVGDTFSFYLDGALMTTQSRSVFVLGTQFLGPDKMSFGDATTGGGASAAHWYNIAVFDSAAPVPEPGTMALAIGGGMVLLAVRRHRRTRTN